ncbi:hypothetical protein BX070DRAFT_223323 [Coemansia spiralis]|nr:hypothetical protein BX070DRAFT_223323 [Coemansia spiralis]
MRLITSATWVLAAAALVFSVDADAVADGSPAATLATPKAEDLNAMALHRRDLLDSLANFFNPSRVANAASTTVDTNDDNNTDNDTNNNNDNTTPADNNNSSSQSSSDTKTTSSKGSTSSSQQTHTSSSGSDTNNDNQTTETSTSTKTRSASSTNTSSADSESPTDGTTASSSSSPSSSSPTPTSSSSYVLVTVTRPNTVITTSVARPTIDDANGDKANVGTSSNLTTIIVAPTVTAIALLLCAIMLFMYMRRKNRSKYGEEDIFAKDSYVRPDNSTSPFIPQEHDSGDGYVKDEATPFYAAGAAAATGAAAGAASGMHGRRTGDSYGSNSSAGDNTHLLANQRPYQQNTGYAPPAATRYQPPVRPQVTSTPGLAPAPVPAPLGQYGPQHTQYQPPQRPMQQRPMQPRPQNDIGYANGGAQYGGQAYGAGQNMGYGNNNSNNGYRL